MTYLPKIILFGILLFSFNGLNFNQDADATVCNGLEWTFMSSTVTTIVGTVISSEKTYYEEPQPSWDGYEDYYTVHKFSVDEIIKGKYLENEITLKMGQADTLKVGSQHILLVGEYEGVFYGADCKSIYDMNKYNTLKMLDALNDDNYNEDFINVIDINVVGIGSDRTVIFVGYIDDALKSESISTGLEELDDGEIFIQLLNSEQKMVVNRIFDVDENGFFSFIASKSHMGEDEYTLLAGIFNEKPKIDRISFSLYRDSYSGTREGEICKRSLEPILKISDLSINCVNYTAREKLMDRNWGTWLVPNDPYAEPAPRAKPALEEEIIDWCGTDPSCVT